MIINEDMYICYKCNKRYFFDTSKPCEDKYCTECNGVLFYEGNFNRDTDYKPELKKPPITYKEPQKPKVECPYCKSTNTKKIGAVKRSVSFGLLGFGSGKLGKQWHCNNCRSDF